MSDELRTAEDIRRSEVLGLEALYMLGQLALHGIAQPGLGEAYLPEDDLGRRKVIKGGQLLLEALGESIPVFDEGLLGLGPEEDKGPHARKEARHLADYPAGDKAMHLLERMVKNPLPEDITTNQIKRFVSKALGQLPGIVTSDQLDIHSTVMQFYLRIDGASDKSIDKIVNPHGTRVARITRHRMIKFLHRRGYPPERLREMMREFLTPEQLERLAKAEARAAKHEHKK